MSNTTKTATKGGVSLATVLVIVFAVLKWTDVIDWSWVWILSPWWITIALGLAIALISIVVLFIYGIIKGIRK